MTGSGRWQPVHGRGRTPDAPAPETPIPPVDAEPAQTPAPPQAPPCIFCDRTSGTALHAWPEWLVGFVTDHQGKELCSGLVIMEQVERELDKTVTCVCSTCSNGWMRRLDDHVSPFVKSMVIGEETPLPPARRKLLARWAAKTAAVMECASDSSVRTPRFANEYLRKVGSHAGTQVLVGRYDGDHHILTYERDLFSRTIDDEKRYLSQASFVMGKLLLQVFADPWRDSAPELVASATHPFITLIGSNHRHVVWPPETTIDDAHYATVRLGQDDDAPAPQGQRDEEALAVPTVEEVATVEEVDDAELEPGGGMDMPADEIVDMTEAPTAMGGAPPKVEPIVEDLEGVEDVEDTAWASPIESELDSEVAAREEETAGEPSAKPARRRLAVRLVAAVLALGLVAGVVGYALHERSNASHVRTTSESRLSRVHTLEDRLRTTTKELNASQAKIVELNRTVTRPPRNVQVKGQPERIRQIVTTAPAVTDGLRRCANAALDTASAALTYASAYPDGSTTAVTEDSATVTSVCGAAGEAADRLDGLVNGVK